MSVSTNKGKVYTFGCFLPLGTTYLNHKKGTNSIESIPFSASHSAYYYLDHLSLVKQSRIPCRCNKPIDQSWHCQTDNDQTHTQGNALSG